ncbi:MAG: hypothetical protein ACN2B6_11820 [Rickettsiales bacterium]
MSKLDAAANFFNKLRIAPRMLVAGYSAILFDVFDWYMALNAPSTEQTAFVSAVTLAGGGIFKFYTETGNKE